MKRSRRQICTAGLSFFRRSTPAHVGLARTLPAATGRSSSLGIIDCSGYIQNPASRHHDETHRQYSRVKPSIFSGQPQRGWLLFVSLLISIGMNLRAPDRARATGFLCTIIIIIIIIFARMTFVLVCLMRHHAH
jgi:hypothetical protein